MKDSDQAMISSLDHARCRQAAIPPTRDPFVNTPLLSLGTDSDGHERFWISTWNNHVGCLAVTVDTAGNSHRYDFKGDRFAGGFYSAVPAADNTLWLCTWLSEINHFNLETEQFHRYETGAKGALMFQGMALDPGTGKLFAIAHPPPLATAIVFDTHTRQPVSVIEDVCPDKYMRTSWRSGDGCWHAILTVPGLSIVHWDPQTDHITYERLSDDYDPHHGSAGYFHLLHEADRAYLPHYGWYGANGFLDDPRRPTDEADWLGVIEGHAYGIMRDQASCTVCSWELSSGKVARLFTVEDALAQSFALTQAGQLASVSLYGEFRLHDLPDGALRLSRWLDTDAVQDPTLLLRITNDRVVGMPFIAQRFWEADLVTGQGRDCGRAAPGGGQVVCAWQLDGLTYWASYTTGSLMVYDPRLPAHYPENPRQVAVPPGGMRPVATASDGRTLFYACNASYGKHGSIMAAYDTHTGTARYHSHPLPHEAITSLWHLPERRQLLASTTIQADCGSAPPIATHSSLALLDATTLHLVAQAPSLPDADRTVILGPLGDQRWLVMFAVEGQLSCGKVNAANLSLIDADVPVPEFDIHYAGVPGWFLLLHEGRTELWDMRLPARHAVLHESTEPHRIKIAAGDLYILWKSHFSIYESFMQGAPAKPV